MMVLENTKHEYRVNHTKKKVECIHCGIEQWKTEPEEECLMRTRIKDASKTPTK